MGQYVELYKKYRPRNWGDIVGQPQVIESLRKAVLDNNIPSGYLFAGKQHGSGKDLHKDTIIPTPTGKTTMGELKIGDLVLGSDGKATKVLDKYCPNDPEIYEITFSDGTVVKAGSGHLWEVESKVSRSPLKSYSKKKVMTTKEMAEDLLTKAGSPKWAIHVSPPAEYNVTSDLPIDPYALGVWLGDGVATGPYFGGMSDDISEISEYINSNTINTRAVCSGFDKRNPDLKKYKLVIRDEVYGKSFGGNAGKEVSIINLLKDLNLYDNKHIPDIYLYGPIKARLDLLAGLLDTDGTVDKRTGTVSIGQKEGVLFDNIVQLIHSLGYKTTTTNKEIELHPQDFRNYPSVHFNPTDKNLFKLSRKSKFISESKEHKHSYRYIKKVEQIKDNPEDYFCIAVDAPDKLFLCTDSFVKTHNTSTALILAKALNCENLLPDGNPCNECQTCKNIDAHRQIGVEYISMANKGSVDDVRDIVSKSQMAQPVKRQVWILDECHRMSTAAMEAWLIPLESETNKSVFIFCSTEPEKILNTVKSRLQLRSFAKIDMKEIAKRLKEIADKEGIDISPEKIIEAAREANGGLRDGIKHLEAIANGNEIASTYRSKILSLLASKNYIKALSLTAEMEKDGHDFAKVSEQLFRDMSNLLLTVSGATTDLSNNPKLLELANEIGAPKLLKALDILGESINSMSFNTIDKRVLFEISLTKIITVLKYQAKPKGGKS